MDFWGRIGQTGVQISSRANQQCRIPLAHCAEHDESLFSIKGKPQITQISQIAEVKAFRRRDAHKFYHERYACRSSSATGTGADNFLPMTDSSSINQEMNFFG